MSLDRQRFAALLAVVLLAVGAACTARPAAAQSFSAVVSPPRIENSAKPGETYRDVIEITNVSAQPTQLSVKTADWHLDPSGGPIFSDELAKGSCRPWVAIEKRELSIGPGAKYRFRFETAVPKDAPAMECRFALMIEGAMQQVNTSGLSLPVSGRIGVIVYLAIGNVASSLALTGYGVQSVGGNKLPTLKISNRGSAHGRVEGFVDATDADGKVFAMIPSSLPILPGEERELVLNFQDASKDKKSPAPHYPLALHGRLYDGHAPIEVSTTLSP